MAMAFPFVPSHFHDPRRFLRRREIASLFCQVRSTLRQFVRDWAKEGQPERQASYQPLISALLKHLPPKRAQGEV